LKASGGINAAVDFAGSDKSLNFATGVLAKGGKVMVTGLIGGGGYATAVAMFPLKAMAIEGTRTGTLKEARELLDLVRAKNIAPPPISERPLDQASKTLDDLRAGKIAGRVVLTA
jgi:alcohol dehydrogenase, propanol-preferring